MKNERMTFNFIADNKFQSLLERDYLELKKCLDIGASKSVMVLAGSIVEATLIEYFLQFMPVGLNSEKVYKLTFLELLNLAENVGLLSARDKNLAWVIKDYRNLIHPGKEIRTKETFDIENARISDALVTIIVNKIQEKYTQYYGYTAEEIFSKLKKDWDYRAIYNKVILKLRSIEKVNLLQLLVNNEIWEKGFWDDSFIIHVEQVRNSSELEYTKPFVTELKPLVPHEVILGYLSQLLKEIESGESRKAFCLYNLFHEDLDYLGKDEADTVATYMLSIFLHMQYDAGDVIAEKTYSTIGKYISSDTCRKVLSDTVVNCAVNFSENNIDPPMNMFEQLFNSLNLEERNLVQKTLNDYYSKWPSSAKEKEPFYIVAVKKRIIESSQTE